VEHGEHAQVSGQFSSLLAVNFLSGVVAQKTPNVLLVIVDDWGWRNVGFHRVNETGDDDWQTPHIDALVANGVELTNHYVHSFCTPTRSALQTGRLPVRVQLTLAGPCSHGNGIPTNMTAIGTKMKQGGYSTHFVGKWDAGCRTPAHTPHGRGYDTSLSYFGHGNWMWDQAEWLGSYYDKPANYSKPGCTRTTKPGWNANPVGCAIDLWDTEGPANTLNGTDNEEFIFMDRIHDILKSHTKTKMALSLTATPVTTPPPLFLVYCPKLVHYPLEAPLSYQQRFSHITDSPTRKMYAAMSSFLDDQIGNVTSAFKEHGLW
jgi:arylsulfatase I/J